MDRETIQTEARLRDRGSNTNWLKVAAEQQARAEKAESELASLRERCEGLVEVAKMVDAWGNGLRHHTAHESRMVKAARATLTKDKGDGNG